MPAVSGGSALWRLDANVTTSAQLRTLKRVFPRTDAGSDTCQLTFARAFGGIASRTGLRTVLFTVFAGQMREFVMNRRAGLGWCAVLALCMAGCNYGPEIAPAPTGLAPRADALRGDVEAARRYVERSLDWRARARTFLAEVETRVGDGVLTSADLTRLYRGAEDYVLLSRRWEALAAVQGDEAWERAEPSLAHDPAARTQTKLVLAAALVQHDDYALGVNPYFKQDKFRKLLKTDHPAVAGELDAAVRRFLDPARRLRLARAVVWYRAEGTIAEDRSDDEIFLDEVITQSPGYQFFAQSLPKRLLAEWATGSHAGVTFVTDLLAQFGATMSHTTSMAVGNTMGLVRTRRGYLCNMPSEERGALSARLRPLDVLLEKTPFRLTDKSIPGHYGHVAVWVGGEPDLRALGVWEEPLVRPHHARIRGGAAIVEALRSGVEINTLDHFLDIDDLLVMRRDALTPEQLRAGVLRAFAQIGKAYDFNFDVESDRRIVCSELAFVVFPDVPWPTSLMLGRHSISPDQVALRAVQGGPFAPVALYCDGVEVREKRAETVECLLKGDRSGFRALHPNFVGRSTVARRPPADLR